MSHLKSCNFCTDMHLPPVCFYIRCCMIHRVHNHMWMLSAPDCPFISVFLNEVIKACTYFTCPNHSPICSVFCVTSSQSTPRFLLQAHTHCTYKHCNHITFLQDAMLALTQNGPFHIERSKCTLVLSLHGSLCWLFTDPTHNSFRNHSVFPVL